MEPSQKEESQDKSKALLIEDNVACQKIMTYYLHQLNYHVDLSDDYDKAVHCVKRKTYDLIIGDINLHGTLLGQGIAEIVRKSELNAATPLIIWSAYINKNDEEKYLAQGADAALTKTCRIEGLKEAIQKSLILRYEKEFRHQLKLLKQKWKRHGGPIELLQTLFDLRHLPLSILVDALNSIIQYQQWSIVHTKEKCLS